MIENMKKLQTGSLLLRDDGASFRVLAVNSGRASQGGEDHAILVSYRGSRSYQTSIIYKEDLVSHETFRPELESR